MMSSAEQTVRDTRRACRKDRSQIVHSPIYPLLYPLNSFTEKDFFVVSILTHASGNKYDPASRIVPALLFQPRFPNRVYEKHNTEDGKQGILFYGQYKEIRKSPLFTGFKAAPHNLARAFAKDFPSKKRQAMPLDSHSASGAAC